MVLLQLTSGLFIYRSLPSIRRGRKNHRTNVNPPLLDSEFKSDFEIFDDSPKFFSNMPTGKFALSKCELKPSASIRCIAIGTVPA